MFGIANGTKSFDVYIEFSVHPHFKLLSLTENEKTKLKDKAQTRLNDAFIWHPCITQVFQLC